MANGGRMVVVGLALACVATEAAADAVIYDSERYHEIETSIEVRGVATLGDVVLVVYPYPCEVSGAFESFEEELPRKPDAKLRLYLNMDETAAEERGYLVVADGERFDSASNYEGPLLNCYFFGLPRSEFPAEDGAIARLDAMTNEERWRLFSRDPSLLRTGVPLAMDGLAQRPGGSRLVTYEARRVENALVVEAVQWLWNGARKQDPRKLSPRKLEVVEPHADRSDDEEAKFFAGSLVGAAWGATPAEKPASVAAPSVAPKSTPAAETRSTPMVEARPPEPAAEPEVDADEPAIAPALVYGGGCLLVAAGAGLLLRRGRRSSKT
jgi:hypothetical protein